MRRTMGAFTVVIAIAGIAVATPPRAIAQDSLTLALVAQNFAIVPDGVAHFDYELTGTIPETTSPSPTPDPAPPADPAAPSTSVVTETTAPAPAEPALTLLVTAFEPITLRSEVAEVLDGGRRSAIDSAEYALSDVLGAEQSGTTSSRRPLALDVQTSTGGEVKSELALPRAGLYPIRVEIRQGRRTLAEHVTFVERLATPESGVFPRSTINLSIVAGIPDPGPEPSPLDVVESDARVTELAQLGEVITAPLTVSLPPVVATSLEDDPELAARLSAALSGDEVLALPNMELDPSSAVAAGQVEAFTRELREGEDALRQALPSTATRRVAWLTSEMLSAPGASMLRDLGVQLVVVPFDLYLALDSNQSAAVRNDLTDPTLLLASDLDGGGEVAVSVVDPINELLETDRNDEGTPAEVAVHLFAELMAIRIQLGPDSRSFILATPDLGIPDPDVLAVIERFVNEHPDVGFQTLSFVPGSTGPFLINDEQVRVTFPPTAGVDLTSRVHAIDVVRLHMENTATMLPADDPRPPQWRAELDTLMSTGIDDTAVAARLARMERELQTIEDAIQPPAPFTFTLAGEATTITLRYRNTGTTALNIGVRVSGPSRLAFPQPETDVLLTPEAITDVTIPIEARSNGTSEVTVEVVTPSGSSVGEPVVLTARVNALSGLGQLLTGAALVVLATWWFSHFRRKRRLRHSAPARNDHPSKGAARTGGEPTEVGEPIEPTEPAPASPADSTVPPSANGDVATPDPAVASSSIEQTEG